MFMVSTILPFANISTLAAEFAHDTPGDDINSSSTEEENSPPANGGKPFAGDFLQKYSKKCKIAHINANSIAGFKFHEIKLWLLNGTFDVLVITETKLDHTFQDAQFTIDGYRFTRPNRTVYGGGVIIYWRSDLIFHYSKSAARLSSIEAILIKLKIDNSWLMVCAAYKPPSIRRLIWMEDLYKLLEYALPSCDDLLVLGDLNCDLLLPEKKCQRG